MAPPPELTTDAVSEILLRLPPDDPAGLVRASAVCKRWFRTLTDPAFLRRYRDFHGTPRVLGCFLYYGGGGLDCFVPTTTFRPHAPTAAAALNTLLDCRHGRVLLSNDGFKEFVVWDPVTGRERLIPAGPDEKRRCITYTNYAVLCAAGAGCDHSSCSGGPFIVAGVGTRCNNCGETLACFYSSETGTWTKERSLCLPYFSSIEDRPAVLVEDALYFDCSDNCELLQYDVLGGHDLLMIKLPFCNYDSAMVMTAGNGELGLATFDIDDDMLVLWSAETTAYGDASWWQIKIIDLEKLLPIDIPMSSARLSGFAEDANLIFLTTVDNGIFAIDLKSLLVRKVCEMGDVYRVLIPYVSFYTPAACARGALQSLLETQ